MPTTDRPPAHTVPPADLRAALDAIPSVKEAWKGLTPLGRSEWICWVTAVKKQETRAHHLRRLCEEILEGKRRPCCWPGCKHR